MVEEQAITSGEAAVRFLKDEAVYPARDELSSEVDMVMKGGITSGVVYPLAVCQLARSHRFRNLGGSSAGGIAAAMAAAAELARGSGGFQRLAALPDELGSNLQAIFQPSPGTRPLFAVLLASIDKSGSKVVKGARVLAAIVRGALGWVLTAVAAVMVLSLAGVLLAAGTPDSGGDWVQVAVATVLLLLPALVLGLVAAAAGLVLGARARLEANGYGLCRGSNGPAPPPPATGAVEPFTDWLHTKLQEVAGLRADDVLTFGHLWGDPGRSEPPDDADVRLEMMTTNVTHCRPVRLPFELDVYYFCPAELALYFPPPVFEHVMRHSRPPASGPAWMCEEHRVPLLHLPSAGKMPVVMAVRMTLSFPVLISAVPLFAIDRSAEPQCPVRCWFSDGGISSNFPIHFFDSLWPKRPTFGISLGPYPTGRPDQHVYLRDPRATAQPRVRPSGTLVGFFAAILDTLQNWSDEGQSTLPGFRDRIVEVRHTEEEGGMNLNMDRERIMSMCLRGYLAAKELQLFHFDHHRWARYRTAMAELDKATANMASKYDAPLPDGHPGYRDFVAALPAGSGDDRGPAWRAKAVARTDLLLRFAGRKADGSVEPVAPDFPAEEPKPAPDLRVVAHF
ncbi:MAG TPA: hypothetical protein VG455_09665 [Acidimicrobiales bacterium]|nr:hypothetical protein [Acidimicrobiales bacterium]